MPIAVKERDREIYPFDHWQDVYTGLLQPAVIAAGLTCHRDDDDFGSRPIALNIWKKIEEADLILCDVSSSNPNVFMELGWAIRAEKPYVIVMDDLTKAPFDVADLNRFHYDHHLRPGALRQEVQKLTKMLKATAGDSSGRWSIVNNLNLSHRIIGQVRPRCTVDIYYHESNFTRKQAYKAAATLETHGISGSVMEHTGPGNPDAAFIGCLVQADEARLVLSLASYNLRYLFRPDYPESEGGDSTGHKIGIGYTSIYNVALRGERGVPVPVSKEQLAFLLNPDHSNTSFQLMLRELTLPAR